MMTKVGKMQKDGNIIIRVITFLCIFYNNGLYSQTKIDSVSIVFKAKLFTVSEYGIASKEDVIRFIQSQDLIYLKSSYKNFIFMKIDFEQPYTLSNSRIQSLLRNCSYYIAYNNIDSRFYKLGGFETQDIDALFNDLELRELDTFVSLNGNYVEDMNMYCMYEYFKMNKRKRKRKGYSCFTKCSEVTEEHVREY